MTATELANLCILLEKLIARGFASQSFLVYTYSLAFHEGTIEIGGAIQFYNLINSIKKGNLK